MSTPAAMTYSVKAYNLSHASENKIHDDAIAQKLGFSGGLVPGVEVYAYACHLPVAHWGRAWLERGSMDSRFLKPVYDGRTATVTGKENGAGLDITLDSEGVLCATATATVTSPTPSSSPQGGGEARTSPSMPPIIDEYPSRSPPNERPPADEASLAAHTTLGIRPFTLTEELATQYLHDVRKTDPVYASEGLAHPGQLLRLCNLILRENVVLQPWIHTGSKVTNFAAGRVGDDLSARGKVSANYERKGHRLVDIDIILVANGSTVLAHVLHTAVYRLRQMTS